MSRGQEEALASIIVGAIGIGLFLLILFAIDSHSTWKKEVNKAIGQEHSRILSSTAAVESLTIENYGLRLINIPPTCKVLPSTKPDCSDIVGPPRDIADVFAQIIEKAGW
jgi:hypothetical protein